MTDLHVETVFCLVMNFSKEKFEFNMYVIFYSDIGILVCVEGTQIKGGYMANKKSVVATNCLYYFYTSKVECLVASCRCVSQVPKHHLNQLLICPL